MSNTPNSEDTVLRYTLTERIVHWVSALFYMYLLATGLAFYTPNLWWLAVVLGGGSTSRFWHPFAGLVFVSTVIYMWTRWGKDMHITDVDRRWNKTVMNYIRNEDDRLNPAGRFNTGQKQYFWAMLYGGLALLASGLVLWFTDSLPWSLRWVRYIAVLVHVIAFLVTVAGFIVHVYMGTAVVRGGFASVIRGEVTRSWARIHHPLWLEEISKK